MKIQPARGQCVGRVCLVVAIAVVSACGEEPADEPAQAASSPVSPVVAPPQRVLDGTWDEGLAAGQSIAVEGTFLGNDPESLCEWTSTSRSRPRSGLDWAIRKDGHCMWVSRGERIFGDQEKILDRASIGRAVQITAFVRSDDTGRLYLELVSGRAPN